MNNPVPDYQIAELESEIYREAIARIVQVSRREVKEILEAMGMEPLNFLDGGLTIHSHLPANLRSKLLEYVELLKGAIAAVCPAEKLILESPNNRVMTFTVQPANPSLIDATQTVRRRQQFKEFINLEARCRVAMQQAQDLIAITDRRGWCLDCNFTKQRAGLDRMDAIGATVDELFPHLADLAHEQLGEAFKYTEIGIYREFTHEVIPGIPQRWRSRTVAYGDEALTQVTLVNNYPWLS